MFFMVSDYYSASYIGWPNPALISMLQSYKIFLNYANI